MHQRGDDSDGLTADRRRGEVARILAAGILRLRARAALPGAGEPGPEKSAESVGDCLELSGGTRLSVHTG
jgi:hypothetical protein